MKEQMLKCSIGPGCNLLKKFFTFFLLKIHICEWTDIYSSDQNRNFVKNENLDDQKYILNFYNTDFSKLYNRVAFTLCYYARPTKSPQMSNNEKMWDDRKISTFVLKMLFTQSEK